MPRGGKREGAGRPKGDQPPARTTGVRLTEHDRAMIDALLEEGESIGDVIRRAISELFERRFGRGKKVAK